jgi:hypothetical protein
MRARHVPARPELRAIRIGLATLAILILAFFAIAFVATYGGS